MQIYDADDAMEVLWNVVSPLADEIPIFKNVMSEDENSVPDSYLLIRADVSDSGRIYGDGGAQLRRSNCDVILVSKSKAALSTDLHNINRKKVKALLDESGVSYVGYNLGYNDVQKISEYSWSVTFIYG